jgi:hypothetical protein
VFPFFPPFLAPDTGFANAAAAGWAAETEEGFGATGLADELVDLTGSVFTDGATDLSGVITASLPCDDMDPARVLFAIGGDGICVVLDAL